MKNTTLHLNPRIFLGVLLAAIIQFSVRTFAQCPVTASPTSDQVKACFESKIPLARKYFTTAANALRPMVGKDESKFTAKEKNISKELKYWLGIDTPKKRFLIPYLIKTFDKAAALPAFKIISQGQDGFNCDCDSGFACVWGKKPPVYVCTAAYQKDDLCKTEMIMHEMLHLVGLDDCYKRADVAKRHHVALKTTDAGTMAEAALSIAQTKDDGSSEKGKDFCGEDGSRRLLIGKGIKDPVQASADITEREEPQAETEFRCAFSLDDETREEWEKENTALLAEVEEVLDKADEKSSGETNEQAPTEEKKEEAPAENTETPQEEGGGGRP